MIIIILIRRVRNFLRKGLLRDEGGGEHPDGRGIFLGLLQGDQLLHAAWALPEERPVSVSTRERTKQAGVLGSIVRLRVQRPEEGRRVRHKEVQPVQ